jgi:hypothetical protein
VSTVRLFASFDLEHDADLRDLLLAQSQRSGSGFEIVACSERGTMSERWSENVRRQLDQVDEVIVICGEHTGSSPQVSAELSIARNGNKPYFLLWGRRERMCTKPVGSKSDEGMFSWTRQILSEQIAFALRNAQPLHIPDHCKRP